MGKPAARVGDATAHGSTLKGAAAKKTKIQGKAAWRVGDQHTCNVLNAPPPTGTGTPHGPGGAIPIPDGGPGVCLIEGMPAARAGDIMLEPGSLVPLPPPNSIAAGAPKVYIGMFGGAGVMSGATSPDGTRSNCK